VRQPGSDARGFRTVKPSRKQKRTPSRLRRERTRLDVQIEETARERQEAWRDGGMREYSSALTRKLNGHDPLYDEPNSFSPTGLYGARRARAERRQHKDNEPVVDAGSESQLPPEVATDEHQF
jgi:hypothetical protein